MASADYQSGIPVLPATPPPRQKWRLIVFVGCCMLGEGWVAPRRQCDDGGRHGWEVLLAAHFVSVLCVVLHFTWLSKDMNSYVILIHMSYEFICRIRTAYLWKITWIVLRDVFLAAIFLVLEPKLFFSLLRGKIVWRQMVRSMHAVRKIRSIRNCKVHT